MPRCILKTNNTDILNLNIDTTNAYRLLSCINSNINNALMSMSFNINGNGYSYITDDLIDLDQSNIRVDSISIAEIITLSTYLIKSDDHSKSFFGSMDNVVDASPAWTPKDDLDITYGNNISCNIYLLPGG